MHAQAVPNTEMSLLLETFYYYREREGKKSRQSRKPFVLSFILSHRHVWLYFISHLLVLIRVLLHPVKGNRPVGYIVTIIFKTL